MLTVVKNVSGGKGKSFEGATKKIGAERRKGRKDRDWLAGKSAEDPRL